MNNSPKNDEEVDCVTAMIGELRVEFDKAGLNFDCLQMINEPFTFCPDRLFDSEEWMQEHWKTYVEYAERCMKSVMASGDRLTYFDQHRVKFFSGAVLTTFNMETLRLGGNSHHILAHGPKGTGKSTFLRSFVKTVQVIGVLVVGVYHDVGAAIQEHCKYKSSQDLDLPSQIITKALKRMGHTPPTDFNPTDLNHLSMWLKSNKMRITFVVDEYHAAFTTDAAASFRTQIYHMINAVNGFYFVIVAGSSVYLRGLCYGKFSGGIEQFPSYISVAANLNSQRSTVVSFDCLTSKQEFNQYLIAQYPDLLVFKDESSKDLLLESLFLATGGNRRAIERMNDQWKQVSTAWQQGSGSNCIMGYYSEIFKVAGKYEPLWFVMMVAVQNHHLLQPGESSTTTLTPFDMLEWITVSSLRETKDNLLSNGSIVPTDLKDAIGRLTCLDEDSLRALYKANDEGGIVLNDTDLQPKPYGPMGIDAEEVIGRGILQHYLRIVEAGGYRCKTLGLRFKVSVAERTTGTISLNDSTAATTLAPRRKKQPQRKEKTGLSQMLIDEESLVGKSVNRSQFLQYLLKDIPDCIGADLCYLKDCNTLCRFQVKLGTSNLYPSDVQEICNKLEKGKSWIEALSQAEDNETARLNVKSFLITSRPMTEDVKAVAANHCVEIIPALDLLPTGVKEWASALNITNDWYKGPSSSSMEVSQSVG
eukprot:scaffold748_cov176-Ochromonas_danica.AAC.15